MKILTPNQKAVLAVLKRAEWPLTVAELAASTRLYRSSVHRIMTVLVRYGCAERANEPTPNKGATFRALVAEQ